MLRKPTPPFPRYIEGKRDRGRLLPLEGARRRRPASPLELMLWVIGFATAAVTVFLYGASVI